jgi:hypothetical protein
LVQLVQLLRFFHSDQYYQLVLYLAVQLAQYILVIRLFHESPYFQLDQLDLDFQWALDFQ